MWRTTEIEIRTGRLTEAQLETEIGSILAFFQANGWEKVAISFDERAKPGQDTRRREFAMPLAVLSEFLTQGQREGLFILGKDDLHIGEEDSLTEFTVTHKRQVHLKTYDEEFANRVRADWQVKRYRHFEVKSRTEDYHTWHPVGSGSEARFYME